MPIFCVKKSIFSPFLCVFEFCVRKSHSTRKKFFLCEKEIFLCEKTFIPFFFHLSFSCVEFVKRFQRKTSGLMCSCLRWWIGRRPFSTSSSNDSRFSTISTAARTTHQGEEKPTNKTDLRWKEQSERCKSVFKRNSLAFNSNSSKAKRTVSAD